MSVIESGDNTNEDIRVELTDKRDEYDDQQSELLSGNAAGDNNQPENDNQGKLLTSDLQLDSRVVFFDDSGVSLHGTIKFIGSFDDVIHAGIELVSFFWGGGGRVGKGGG